MASSTPRLHPERAGTPEDVLSWRVWPLVQRPLASGALVLFILAVSLYSLLAFGHPAYALLALVVLIGAVADHLLPTSYRMDPDGITVRAPFQTRRRRWDEFLFFATGPQIVVLTDNADLHTPSARRNLWVRVGKDRSEVIAYLAQRLEDVTYTEASGKDRDET